MQERLLSKRAAVKYIACKTARDFDKLVAVGELPLPIPTPFGDRWDRHDLDAYVDGLKGERQSDWRSRSKLYALEAH